MPCIRRFYFLPGKFSYFDKATKDENEDDFKEAPPPKNAQEMIKNINAKYSEYEKPAEEEKAKKLLKKQSTDCYTECYPGMDDDHNYDSDEEADFTKMDQVIGSGMAVQFPLPTRPRVHD